MAMQALVLLVVLDGSRDWGLAVFVLPVGVIFSNINRCNNGRYGRVFVQMGIM